MRAAAAAIPPEQHSSLRMYGFTRGRSTSGKRQRQEEPQLLQPYLRSVDDKVVGTQPRARPPPHKAPAGSVEALAAFSTAKLRPLENDVHENQPFEPRPNPTVAKQSSMHGAR